MLSLQLSIASLMAYLVKHCSEECGQTWWFLDEVVDFQHFDWCRSKTMLKMLKDIRCARFVRRYDSEEKLNIDVDLKYSMNGSFMMKDVG